MSRLLLSLVLVFVAGCYTTFDPNAPVPAEKVQPQRANQIVVRTADGPEDAYRRLGQILVGRDYALATSDNVMLSLTTDWKQSTRSRLRVVAFVSESDTGAEITLKGQLKLQVNVGQALFGSAMAEDMPTPVEQGYRRGSPAGDSFAELEAIAQAYPEGQVSYTRK